MKRADILALGLVLATMPVAALASDNLRDIARAQRDQADSLRRIKRIEADWATQQDRAQRNAERDSRSSRRFDRP